MQINDRTLQALARLEGDSDFAEVRKHLEAELVEAHGQLAQANDLLLIGRCQGTVQTLSEFLQRAKDARGILAKRSA